MSGVRIGKPQLRARAPSVLGRRPPGEGQRGLSDNLNAYSCDQTLTMPYRDTTPVPLSPRSPANRSGGVVVILSSTSQQEPICMIMSFIG
jgi:hypothetical protein